MRHWHFLRTGLLLGILPWAAALGARAAEILVLSNGDRLTGHLVKHTEGRYTFHSDLLGDVTVADTAAKIVVVPGGPHAAGTPVAAAKAKPAKAPVAAAGASKPWTGKFEVGYNNEMTNVRSINSSVLAEVDRPIGEDALMVKARYLYGETGGQASANEQDAEFRDRHTLTNRLFAQTDTTESSDQIQLVNFEGEENLGLGYKVIGDARQTVDVGGGLTGQYLDAQGVERGFDYLGDAFQDYTVKLTDRYTFCEDASMQYSPEERARYGLIPGTLADVESGDERDYAYKLHTTLTGKITDHLSLNLHWEYEFDNVVLDPASRAEERVTTTIGYGF